MKNSRTLDGPAARNTDPTFSWFVPIDTIDGPARLWRFIPAEAFAQVKHFERVGIDRATLGDVPPATEDQHAELARFVGRSLACADRDVHRYQGTRGAQYLETMWPQEELLRVAKLAAIWQQLRVE